MTQRAALTELIAKIEAGWPPDADTPYMPPFVAVFGEGWQAKSAWDANQGDMNAALCLVPLLLPGAWIRLQGPSMIAGWDCSVEHERTVPHYGDHPTSPARALLLATLRAYRDTLPEEDA